MGLGSGRGVVGVGMGWEAGRSHATLILQSLLSSGTARTSKNMQSFDFKTNWDLQVAPLTVTLLNMTPPIFQCVV